MSLREGKDLFLHPPGVLRLSRREIILGSWRGVGGIRRHVAPQVSGKRQLPRLSSPASRDCIGCLLESAGEVGCEQGDLIPERIVPAEFLRDRSENGFRQVPFGVWRRIVARARYRLRYRYRYRIYYRY
ncbi:MAG: hypothetical protein NUW01_06725, partial [Gemmatimonadaceae bacterium]|nr:hypothetical protein [Gemmatimonadaceae bacterium]